MPSCARLGPFDCAQGRLARAPVPTQPRPHTSVLEFHGHESCRSLAHVRHGVGVACWQPLDVAGLEFSGHRAHAFYVAAYLEVGNRNQQMRRVVMVAGRDRARFEVEPGHADTIFHKKNFSVATGEDLLAGFSRPMGWRLPQFVILHQLNRHIAKRLVGEIPGDVGKVSRCKSGIAIRESDVRGWLALDFVGEVRVADGDEDVVVAMAVHERGSMGRDLDFEYTYIFVVDDQVVRGFSGDLDLGRRLGEQGWNQQAEEQYTLHGREL